MNDLVVREGGSSWTRNSENHVVGIAHFPSARAAYKGAPGLRRHFLVAAVHAGSKHELLFPMLPIGDGPRDKY